MKYQQTTNFLCLTSLLLLAFQTNCHTINAPISYGELVDKITILKIKSERINNEEKLNNVRKELALLQKIFDTHVKNKNNIAYLQQQLQEINTAIWEIEDAIRIKERNKEFDAEFIAIARAVYVTNDKRCALKKSIDIMLGSYITEEKSYEELT